jgi:pantothenate kinase
VPSPTFEDAGEWLAERAVSLAEQRRSRVLIGITGPPGGGKSSLAALVRERADALLRQKRRRTTTSDDDNNDNNNNDNNPNQSLAVVLPMDGFHYTRAQLDAFPDPRAAHARRGAPWTFDAQAFVATVAAARSASGDAKKKEPLLVPSFDHAVKDPVADQIVIGPEAEVVIVEGNYLLLDEEPWRRLWKGGEGEGEGGEAPPQPPPLLDETWFVDSPLEAAMAHIFARQTKEVGLTPEESRKRVEENDGPNARLVVATRERAGVLVPGELPMRGS